VWLDVHDRPGRQQRAGVGEVHPLGHTRARGGGAAARHPFPPTGAIGEQKEPHASRDAAAIIRYAGLA